MFSCIDVDSNSSVSLYVKIKHNAFDYLSSFFDIEEIVKKLYFQ